MNSGATKERRCSLSELMAVLGLICFLMIVPLLITIVWPINGAHYQRDDCEGQNDDKPILFSEWLHDQRIDDYK